MHVDINTVVVCLTVLGVAGLLFKFDWSKLHTKAVQPMAAAVELEDKLLKTQRSNDERLYELETQVSRITSEREADRQRFRSDLEELKAERAKINAMLSQVRVPHARMG